MRGTRPGCNCGVELTGRISAAGAMPSRDEANSEERAAANASAAKGCHLRGLWACANISQPSCEPCDAGIKANTAAGTALRLFPLSAYYIGGRRWGLEAGKI